MSSRQRPSLGLNPAQFNALHQRERLEAMRRFLPRSASFAAFTVLVFWLFDWANAAELAPQLLVLRTVAATGLLACAALSRLPQAPWQTELLSALPPGILILCVAGIGFWTGQMERYAGPIGLIFALTAAWLMTRRSFLLANLIMFGLVYLLQLFWAADFNGILWTNILLGSLCGALFFDFLWRLDSRALRLRQELQTESRTDVLTGLPNRRAFFEYAEDAWKRAQRRGKSVAVAIIDIDHFKNINDQYGHDIGDSVLQSLACALGNAVGGPESLARLGGEEFAWLALDVDTETWRQQCDAVRRAVENYEWHLDDLPKTTISIGAAVFESREQESDRDFSATLKRADMALYLAKSRSRNCVAMS